MVAVLAAVAIALTGQQVTLQCGPLPNDPYIPEHAVGLVEWPADGSPPNITILPWVCRSAYYRREHFGLKVLAHEILHVRPNRTEAWTRRWDDWYAENVVRWKLRRLR